MFKRILSLVVKEFVAVWRDKQGRIALIAPPLIQLMLFSFAATLDVDNISLAILNQDSGKPAYELVQRFQGAPRFTKIQYLDNSDQIDEVIDQQKALAVLSLQPDFSRKITKQIPVDVQVILDGRRSNAAQIVFGYINQILQQFNQDLMADSTEPRLNVELVPRNWFNPNLNFMWYTVPALVGILVMLISIVVTALSVARERELGTFEQLLVTPLNSLEIIIGKMIPAFAIAYGEGMVIFAASIFVFQIPFTGSLLVFTFTLIIFIFSVIGVGLFISSLAKTQQQAMLGTFIFMTPAVALSGFAAPIENMPEWLQVGTLINPMRHFLVSTKGLYLKDMSFDLVWYHTYPNIIIATVTLLGAAYMFRRRVTA